jgi:hypothetical protein
MCKSQYDIEVEQQRTRIERKKERDTMKHLHNYFRFQLPRSPISPTPPEVEIPTFDQRVRTMKNSNMINEYGSLFFVSGEGSSSSAASPPPPGSEEVPQPFGAPQGPAAYEGPIRRPERGGSEWEPIKNLLEGDRNSNMMNLLGRTPKITRSALLPSVCQNHVAT